MVMAAMQQVERPVPYDIAAEEAVLGSLLLDRDAIIKIAPFLRAEDFYREAHGWIYGAVLDLYNRREPPDTVTLSAELERTGDRKSTRLNSSHANISYAVFCL